MREYRTSGSMRRGERRVMVHSANGHRTRKGGNGGAPPDLDTTALAFHSTIRGSGVPPIPSPPLGEREQSRIGFGAAEDSAVLAVWG